MKKLFVILLILTAELFAQFPEHRPNIFLHNRLPFFTEVHIIPGDSLNTIEYLYKIPYNQLTFVKDADQYKAALSFAVEVYDTTGQFIFRQIKLSNVTVDNFSETNLADNYCEDFMIFHLANNDFNFLPVITDVQSGQEVKLEQISVNKMKSDSSQTLNPFVINENRIESDGNKYPVLTNYEDAIPFSSKQYELAIPCMDTLVQKLYVRVIDQNDTVFSNYISDSFLSDLSLYKVEGQVVIRYGVAANNNYRNFILNNFSNLLSEGIAKIIVSKNKEEKDPRVFIKNVVWFDKPFSLRNPESAISSLKYIESDSVVSKLLDADQKQYPAELQKYWQKYDPTPKTKFNELMNEYYNRVDYAMKNFAPLASNNGADTDRGKIYIKYGMPEKIERSSNDDGKVVELWIYSRENLSFKFVDKNGTGEFPLAKG